MATGRISDQRPCGLVELEGLGQNLVQILHRDSQPGVTHFTGTQNLLFNPLCHIDWNGKRQSLVTAGTRIYLGIDADHLAAHIDQWPA